jgi:hypothetical protein
VERIEARIRTCDARFAGTDDTHYLRINARKRFKLDKRLYDDFERGDRDIYSVPIDNAGLRHLSLGDIRRIQIEKSPDRLAGGWKLCGVRITVNGRTAYSTEGIGRWLEDDNRVWRATNFRRRTNPGSKLPVWLQLKEDDRVYGSDDHGDINRYDRRRDVIVGYTPGTTVQRVVTGGKRYGGRVGDGDKARLRYRLDTITPTPILSLPPIVPEVPTPPPVVDPPAPPPTTTPPGPKPDLTVTAFTFSSVTVRNQGEADSGPFRVNAGGVIEMFDGLAAGASETRSLKGLRCQDTYTAAVDDLNMVDESDETNNTRESGFVIC